MKAGTCLQEKKENAVSQFSPQEFQGFSDVIFNGTGRDGHHLCNFLMRVSFNPA